MAHDTIDIPHVPEILHLAEAIRERNMPAVLRRGDEELAVMVPVVDNRKRKARRGPFGQKSQADIDAFLAAAGGRADLVDTEQLKRDIAESRARSDRPPVNL